MKNCPQFTGISLIAVCCLALFVSQSFAQGGETVQKAGKDYSRVILRVNGMEFHKWEMNLAEILTQDQMFHEGNYFRPSEMPAFREVMMEGTIGAMLFYMEAQEQGQKLDTAKVEDFIWSFQKRFPSMASYEKGLRELNVTPEQFRQVAERYVLTQDYLDNKFGPVSRVSENEAREYYEDHPENFIQPELVRASHILVKFEEGSGKKGEEKALNQANKIKKRLERGENFAKTARKYSDCNSKKRGGDLGYLQKGDLAQASLKPLEEVVFGLNIGQISEPVESIYGYHILYLEDRKLQTPLEFEEVRDRLMAKMTEDRKASLIMEYSLKLKESARIERLETP